MGETRFDVDGDGRNKIYIKFKLTVQNLNSKCGHEYFRLEPNIQYFDLKIQTLNFFKKIILNNFIFKYIP